MSRPAARAIIILVALAHATLYIVYQRPDWTTEWTDQHGYTLLGRVLAETGRFTRYPDHPRFVPEVIRTPGYPVFVAVVNRVIGQGRFPVAMAQALLFAAICLLVYAIARRMVNDRMAFAAALLTALYPPLPYFAALTLTEVFTTFLVTLGLYLWLRSLAARGGNGWAAGAGAILAWAALTRPSFQYLPLALVPAAWLVAPRGPIARRRSVLMLAAFAGVLAPWLLYNVISLKMLTFTPAGGIGRALWEGTWQVVLPGRVQATLTDMADTAPDRAALDELVRAYAGRVQMDSAPMLRYVHQWQDIRRIWTEPQEPWERARARVVADREYQRVAVENIRRDPLRHAWRRATRGVLLLWVTEIPIRYSDINALSTTTIRLIWAPQALLIAVAIAGLYVLWRMGGRMEAAAFAALMGYVTAVHAVLYSEARYALPAKPVVLLLATIALSRFFTRTYHRGFFRLSSASFVVRNSRPLSHRPKRRTIGTKCRRRRGADCSRRLVGSEAFTY
jgi:4-amino-4-deoxy-L-arabinose transferase-like glycosyltransferase